MSARSSLSQQTTGSRGAGKLLKRTLPWIASVGIVVWLFSSVDRQAFLDGLAKAKMVEALVWIAAFSALVFLADSAALKLLFNRLLGPIRYREVLAVKGVSYFLNAITYSAGAGSIAYFAHKKLNVSFLRSLSTLVWLNFVDVISLWVLLGGGWLFGRELLPDPVLADRIGVLLVGVGLIATGAQVYWRYGIDFLLLGRFRSWRIFQSFADATWSDLGVILGVRVLFIGLYVVMAWVLLPTFHIHIDLVSLLVYVPLLTFVQTIPASVAGLGAVQAVMIALYGPYVDPEIASGPGAAEGMVLAFSTVIGPSTALIRIVLGYFFVHDISRDLLGSDEEFDRLKRQEEQEESS